MRRARGEHLSFIGATAIAMTVSANAFAAGASIAVAPSTVKVRPNDTPLLARVATLRAARNEFESFQIVVRGGSSDTAGVRASLSSALTGPAGATIPATNVVLYAERYYGVGTPSNDEGAAGAWPDPLVPDVDTYVGEPRNAFPLTVPARETRVVWVDVLVPIDQAAGDYAGAIRVATEAGEEIGTVAVNLHVGDFTLPSTATLASAYGFGWGTAAQVHCGGSYPFCATEDAANAIRALYMRAGLDHRITLTPATFQPPLGAGAVPFEKWVLPLVEGRGPTRLPGAKLTTVQLDGGPSTLASWLAYAKAHGFVDRLFYYPVDEPGNDAAKWSDFAAAAKSLHDADGDARVCLTASMPEAAAHGAESSIDVFVPVLDRLHGRPESEYAGDQRASYDAWLRTKPNRRLWVYQSCDQHGCGACGEPSPGVAYTGWPQRVIDSSGVQDRAMGWVAWQEGVSGELYFAVDHQLATAWDANGQCAFSGSGDGTLFYPGKPAIIGGQTDIPIESIRLKLIRDGMEDYEYLTLVAQKDPALARSIAGALFPTPYECAKSPADLEAARDALFAALDEHAPAGANGGAGGADAETAPSGAASPEAGVDPPAAGCACTTVPRAHAETAAAKLLALAMASGLLRRRRAQ